MVRSLFCQWRELGLASGTGKDGGFGKDKRAGEGIKT